MRVGRQKNAVVAETSMTVTVVVVVAAVTAAAVLRGGGGVGWSRQSPREGGLEGGGGMVPSLDVVTTDKSTVATRSAL